MAEGGEPIDKNALKQLFGVNAWKQWVLQKNEQMAKGSRSSRKFKLFKTDLLQLPPDELNYSLSLFVKEVRKPDGGHYGSGSIYYLCLGIQKHLFLNGRIDNIFSDPYYERFNQCLNDIIQSDEALAVMEVCVPAARVEEEALWESKQLGAHSPYALLNTIMYFNTKYFKLKTAEEHMRVSFANMYVVYEPRNPGGLEGVAYLRYYPNGRKCFKSDCRHSTFFCFGRDCILDDCKHKDNSCSGQYDCLIEDCKHDFCLALKCETPECKHAVPVCLDAPRKDPSDNPFRQVEHAADSLRCPVRLYEFYISKCPESCRKRADMFYINPERSCVPDSAVWYSGTAVPYDVLSKMFGRIRIIREIFQR